MCCGNIYHLLKIFKIIELQANKNNQQNNSQK